MELLYVSLFITTAVVKELFINKPKLLLCKIAMRRLFLELSSEKDV